MKRLEIIVTPAKLDDVKRTLLEGGVQGMTINRSEGFTWDKGQKRVYRGQEYTVDTMPMVTINSVVDDSMVDNLVGAVTSSARTGNDGQGRVGDGKILSMTWHMSSASIPVRPATKRSPATRASNLPPTTAYLVDRAAYLPRDFVC